LLTFAKSHARNAIPALHIHFLRPQLQRMQPDFGDNDHRNSTAMHVVSVLLILLIHNF
jgi:hypothetical protein